MRILILGSGAREHALVLALAAEGVDHELFVAPGNAGIAQDAQIVDLDPEDAGTVTEYANDESIDVVIIGPEAPLVAGVADSLRERGIPVFGPGRAAAQLEGSKTFAKRVMDAAGVATARATRALTEAEVDDALAAYGAPYVVKADGLAAGKGVLVTSDLGDARTHAKTYLTSGPVLIEEHLTGPEVSVFFVSDGDTVHPLGLAQDHKRAFDGDAGPNTGGMGAYSPLPWLDERFGSEAEFIDRVTREVATPIIRQLDAEGTPFIGLLYAGLMLTDDGIRVIEFNARFGDPETQVVLPRLRTPLSRLLMSAAVGTLEDEPRPELSDTVAVTVVLASEGYPQAPVTGRVISGLDAAAATPGVHLAHAATAEGADGLVASGGRVLNVVGQGATFAEARARAYEALAHIALEGSHHRSDIAAGVGASAAAGTAESAE